eukprot:3066951-Rhodomonas_salina.1
MKRFCWYKLVPDGGRRPAPMEHAPPHLRCYNLQKTLLLLSDGARFVNKVHLPPDPTHEGSPDRCQTKTQIRTLLT